MLILLGPVFIKDGSEAVQFFARQLLTLNEMCNQRSQRTSCKLGGKRFHLADRIGLAIDLSGKKMYRQTAVARYISLVFQALQQSLHGPMLRFRRVRIKLLAYVPGSQPVFLPKQFHDRQFRVSQRWFFHSLSRQGRCQYTTCCRNNATRHRKCQGEFGKFIIFGSF